MIDEEERRHGINAMSLTVLAAALLAAQTSAASAPAEVRSLVVSITDDKGSPVRDLQKEEVAVVENGVAREPVRVEADGRPLTVALLVDTSQATGSSFRLNVAPAVGSFLGRLPSGTRYALWTTGDRPTKLVDFTDDPAEATRALGRVAPQGGSTMLDALVEASKDLKKLEGARTAVVAVSALGPEFSGRDRHRVVDEAKTSGAVFYAVEFEDGPASFEDRQAYDFALSNLTKDTGGLLETTLSSMGLQVALGKVATDLAAQYRLSYATLPEAKAGKLEVKVARPGVRVRVGPKASKP